MAKSKAAQFEDKYGDPWALIKKVFAPGKKYSSTNYDRGGWGAPKTKTKKAKPVASTKAKGGPRLKGAHKGPSPKQDRPEKSKKYADNGGVAGTKTKGGNRFPAAKPRQKEPTAKPQEQARITKGAAPTSHNTVAGRALKKKKKKADEKFSFQKAIRKGFGRVY